MFFCGISKAHLIILWLQCEQIQLCHSGLKEKLFFPWIWRKNRQLRQLSYFREFWRFFANFWCKWKLRSLSKKWKRFLPPSLVFYPPFLLLKITTLDFPESILCKFSLAEKGVKTSEGVKNFWFEKYGISAFFCTKNYVKIFKTRWNRFAWLKWNNCLFFLAKKNKIRENPAPRFKEIWQQKMHV